MSKEAMKLALEALEELGKVMVHYPMAGKAITALREALAEQQLSEPCRCGKQTTAWCMANTCSKAQQALDKKAENARELGLDYEPVCNKDPQGCWNVRCQLGKKCKNTPAQQKPFGYFKAEPFGWTDCAETDEGAVALYARPPAQQEPIYQYQMADGSWIDQAKHSYDYNKSHAPNAVLRVVYTSPPAQRTWVGLVWGELPEDGQNHDFLRGAVWAETKLKEKNT